MTLQEAINDIQRQMDTFMMVYLDADTVRMIERATQGNDQWSGIYPMKYRSTKNSAGKWIYGLRLEQAEEMRDAAREALARQVTQKLVGP